MTDSPGARFDLTSSRQILHAWQIFSPAQVPYDTFRFFCNFLLGNIGFSHTHFLKMVLTNAPVALPDACHHCACACLPRRVPASRPRPAQPAG